MSSDEEVLGWALGPLERRVMQVVWDAGRSVNVTDVQAALGNDLAYTTVMTTLDRLYKKSVLVREKQGRAFQYAPALSRPDMERGVVARILERLLGGDAAQAEPILSSLVDTVTERDRALLDELERLVRAKKRQLR
jgi:predicted transcriptional regulator